MLVIAFRNQQLSVQAFKPREFLFRKLSRRFRLAHALASFLNRSVCGTYFFLPRLFKIRSLCVQCCKLRLERRQFLVLLAKRILLGVGVQSEQNLT